MFDSRLLRQFRYLWLLSRELPGGGFLTHRPSRLPAGGTELTSVRDYSFGDDYRHIDWNACARHDELRTKQFQGEQDAHVYILLDCSRSMSLGEPRKFDVARQIAALLGYLGLANMARVGVVGFADRVTDYLPTIRGTARLPKLLRFLDALSPEGPTTDLAQTAARFVRGYHRHGLAVVISDLYAPGGFGRGLETLRTRGYEPRVVQIYDRLEAQGDLLGDVDLFDVEGRTVRSVRVTERDLKLYRKRFDGFRDSVTRYCAVHNVGCVQADSRMPPDELLRKVATTSPTGTRPR